MKNRLFSLLLLFLFCAAPGIMPTASGQHKTTPKKGIPKKNTVKKAHPVPAISPPRPAVTAVSATTTASLTSIGRDSTNQTAPTTPASSMTLATTKATTPATRPAQPFGLMSLLRPGSQPTGADALGNLFATSSGDTLRGTRYGVGAVLYLKGGLMATITRKTGRSFGQLGFGALMSSVPGQKMQYVGAFGAGVRLNDLIRVGGQVSVTWSWIAAYGLTEQTLTTPGVGLIGIYTPSTKVWVQATANTNTGTAVGLTYFL